MAWEHYTVSQWHRGTALSLSGTGALHCLSVVWEHCTVSQWYGSTALSLSGTGASHPFLTFDLAFPTLVFSGCPAKGHYLHQFGPCCHRHSVHLLLTEELLVASSYMEDDLYCSPCQVLKIPQCKQQLSARHLHLGDETGCETTVEESFQANISSM